MRIKGILTGALAAFCLVSIPAADAAEPADTAVAFYDHLRAGNYSDAAALFDPGELANFRDMLRIIYEQATEADVEQLEALFGAGITVEKLNQMSDSEFFSSFLMLIFQQLQASGSFSMDGIEIIGSVLENGDRAHVVIRQKVGFGANSIEMMDVMSTRLIQGEWKLVMKANTKALAEQIRQTFENR